MMPLNRLWHRSTRSGEGGNCVEARLTDVGVEVRDSKSPTGPSLTFEADSWTRFLTAVRAGKFDPQNHL